MTDPAESPARATRQKSTNESSVSPSGSKKSINKGKKPLVPPKPKMGTKTPSKSTGGKKGSSKNTPKSTEKIPKASLEVSGQSLEIEVYQNPSSSKSEPKPEPESSLDAILHSEDDSDDRTLVEISIPETIRNEAGPHWRLKEAILASYHYGRATISAADFARSNSDSKTAEIITNEAHTWDSKKHHVKLHLANYQRWVRSATMCTTRLRGKRKMVVQADAHGTKSRRTSENQSTPPVICDILAGQTYDTFVKEQINLENMR